MLRKLVTGWALIAGMIVYTCLLGMAQLYRAAAQRVTAALASLGVSRD